MPSIRLGQHLLFFQEIPAPGLELEFIMVLGSSFDDAFDKWGNALLNYHSKPQNSETLTSQYLGTVFIFACFTSISRKVVPDSYSRDH